jgi:SAM-dependent methyltransferase
LCCTRDTYACAPCSKQYPVILGIPDFRVFQDPYIDFDADRAKGLQLAERYAETDYRGLIEYYWSITPDVPDDMVRRFVHHALVGDERGRHLLGNPEISLSSSQNRIRLIELGCRTGGLLEAAAERFEEIVGIDIAFRWLVIAKKRMQQCGIPAQLVCCCAEFLPFADETFDCVVAENVIEHTVLQAELIGEAHRVVRSRGVFVTVTCNRYSLGPEPHVRLWGVGWIPRRWMNAYVKWRRNVEYKNIRLLSIWELFRMLCRSPFSQFRIRPATFDKTQRESLSPVARRLIDIYHFVRNWPAIRSLLLLFAPVFHVVCSRK